MLSICSNIFPPHFYWCIPPYIFPYACPELKLPQTATLWRAAGTGVYKPRCKRNMYGIYTWKYMEIHRNKWKNPTNAKKQKRSMPPSKGPYLPFKGGRYVPNSCVHKRSTRTVSPDRTDRFTGSGRTGFDQATSIENLKMKIVVQPIGK